MSESEFNLLSKFGSLRTWFAPTPDNYQVLFRQPADESVVDATSQLQALAYYEALMDLPVARKDKGAGTQSLFKDMIWDFNPNYPDAARNVRGGKLRMDWSKYPDVSPVVLLEMKLAFYLYYLAPTHIYGGVIRKKNHKKANSIVANFQHGMKFLNEMSVRDQQEFGKDYVLHSGQGVKNFDLMSYQDAAKNHEFPYSADLRVFFCVLRSPYLAENLFGGYLPYVDLDALEWKYVSDVKEDQDNGKDSAPVTSEVLPNSVFERSSYSASMLVVDFLATLGEPIVDIDTLRRRNARQFKRAESHGLSQRLMKMYTFMRLKQKGYSDEHMASVMGGMPDEFLTQRRSKDPDRTTISKPTLIKLSEGRLNDDLRIYLNQVNYSCCYLVAQYTGMRPSELSQIILDDALEEDGAYWLIKSHVVKHRDSYGKLFDDTWVAIPIIRDAIAAAQICARYKQSPYLFSSVDTVAPGETSSPLESNGLRYQLNTFFEHVLPEDEYQSLVFTPYMLRHTLAYQLYRADVGLPFISHQLKHFGEIVGGYQNRGYSAVTLVYGHIGDIIEMGGRKKSTNQYRHMAEKEVVRLHYDPDGNYAGTNAAAHKTRNQALFKMYQDAGFSAEEVFEALVAKGIAIVNIGMGMCYGGRVEDFDESLPCIGGLRCNPNRCPNSVITKAHAPKWREIYTQNQMLLTDPLYQDRLDQIYEVINEAKGVLEYLGEKLELEV